MLSSLQLTKNLNDWEGINCLYTDTIGYGSTSSSIQRTVIVGFDSSPCTSKIHKLRCTNDHLHPSVIVFLPSKGGVENTLSHHMMAPLLAVNRPLGSATRISPPVYFLVDEYHQQSPMILWLFVFLLCSHHYLNLSSLVNSTLGALGLVWDLLQYSFWMAFWGGIQYWVDEDLYEL